MRSKSAFLKSLPLFAGLPASFLDGLGRKAEEIRLERHATLRVAGEACAQVYVVRAGVLRASFVAGAEEAALLGLFGRGSWLGFECLWPDVGRGAQLQAHDDATVYAWSAEAWREACAQRPPLWEAVARVRHRDAMALGARLEILVQRPVQARLAWALLELGRRFGVRDARGILLSVKVTQRDLALLVGATRESVSLALTELRGMGVVVLDGRRLVIHDAAALEQLV